MPRDIEHCSVRIPALDRKVVKVHHCGFSSLLGKGIRPYEQPPRGMVSSAKMAGPWRYECPGSCIRRIDVSQSEIRYSRGTSWPLH